MIEQAWIDAGISYFANKSGANLLSGVTAEFAMHSTLGGKCKFTHALIESDEAAFKAISKYVDAKVIVVTNIFRDQLDRYGEVTHTRNNIKIGIEHSPNAQLCLNADDSLTASLAEEVPNPVLYYGVNTPIYRDRVQELSDAPYCLHCKHAYTYDYVTYGHLAAIAARPAATAVRRPGSMCRMFSPRMQSTPKSIWSPGARRIAPISICRAATIFITHAPAWQQGRPWSWMRR